MSQRYYLCPLVQNSKGQWVPSIKDNPAFVNQGDPDGQGGFVPPNFSIITSGFTSGQPDVTWCLLVTSVKNHQSVAALSDVFLMPDYPLDAKMNAMQSGTKAAMESALSARGIPSSSLSSADGYRDVMHEIGRNRLANAGFNVDAFNA